VAATYCVPDVGNILLVDLPRQATAVGCAHVKIVTLRAVANIKKNIFHGSSLLKMSIKIAPTTKVIGAHK